MTEINNDTVTVTTKVRDIPLKLSFKAIKAIEGFFETSLVKIGPPLIEDEEPNFFYMIMIYIAMSGRKMDDHEAVREGTIEMFREVGMEEAIAAIRTGLKKALYGPSGSKEQAESRVSKGAVEPQKHKTDWDSMYGMGAAMGWTPDAIKKASWPELLMCFQGWRKAHGISAEDSPFNEDVFNLEAFLKSNPKLVH